MLECLIDLNATMVQTYSLNNRTGVEIVEYANSSKQRVQLFI